MSARGSSASGRSEKGLLPLRPSRPRRMPSRHWLARLQIRTSYLLPFAKPPEREQRTSCLSGTDLGKQKRPTPVSSSPASDAPGLSGLRDMQGRADYGKSAVSRMVLPINPSDAE